MNGNASGARLASVPAASSTALAFGPHTQMLVHCDVTTVRYTLRSGHSICSNLSRCFSTWPAAPVPANIHQ